MYQKSFQSWVKHLDFIMIDLLCLHLSFLAGYFIRNGLESPYLVPTYRNMAIVFTLIQIVVAIFFGTMKNVLKRGYWKEFTATLKNVCLVELLCAFYLFTTQEAAWYSRTVLYLTGIFYAVSSYLARIGWKKILKHQADGEGRRSLLIVTTDALIFDVVEDIKENNYELFHVAGIALIDKDFRGGTIQGVPVVADASDAADYACREWVDEVFVCLPEHADYPADLVNQFTDMGIVVHLSLMKAAHLTGKKQFVEKMGEYTVLTTSMNYASPLQLLLKRTLDIMGGLVGCILTAAAFVFVAPMIYLKSPGPIFFSQIRVGKNGKKFKMYKFRSMYLDAEERKRELMEENRVKDGMMFKLDWDPRIIGARMVNGKPKKGIGNYIRDLSIDELPQFFNVLKGDMSLVGTRPPTVDEWDKYELHHRKRLAAKPGITGMWQVSGRSNITDFEEVVKLDTKYINEWSFGLDIRILFKTVLVVLGREGSM